MIMKYKLEKAHLNSFQIGIYFSYRKYTTLSKPRWNTCIGNYSFVFTCCFGEFKALFW